MAHIALRHTALVAAALLAGCAGLGPVALVPGESESSVLAKLGQPTRVIGDQAGSGRILEYMNGPFGQTTYHARIDSAGRLMSYEQVLTTQKFAEIKVGTTTKADVLRLIGTPSETVYLALPKLEVWSYPYKENPIADSMMHVHFNNAGIVQKMLNGPDLRRDPERRGRTGFGFGSRNLN